jgi:hypothetical protein
MNTMNYSNTRQSKQRKVFYLLILAALLYNLFLSFA